MALRHLIERHFTSDARQADPEQIAREQWLIPGLPKFRFNRYALFPAAFFIQVGVSTMVNVGN
jgi:hypothetical protein